MTLRQTIPDGNIQWPIGFLTDSMVDDGTAIDADKLQFIQHVGTNFDTAIGGTPAAREEIVYVSAGTGTLRGFHALLNVTGSTTDIDFDLKVNGSSVLSAVVNITNSDGDGTVKDGTISSTALTADDIVSISMAVTSNTGAQGAYAWVMLEEDSAPS